MDVQQQIRSFIVGLEPPKRSDFEVLHELMVRILPEGQLWFEDGRNSDNKTVANPTIGYGFQTLNYADGKTKDFFQIGISSNKTGISVYILGLKDKTYLIRTFEKEIGKAKVTGYCIRFKSLKDINIDVLETAIRVGLAPQHE